MIPLPESLTVKRSLAAEANLLAKARAWLEKDERSPGLHATDLMDLRIAFWQRADPQPISDRLVTIFMVGKILHAFVLGSIVEKVDISKSDEGSKFNEELGISYSMDYLDEGIPSEFKSSRSFYEPKDVKDLEIYLEQLLIYMVSIDSTVGKLWILYLNLKDEQRRTSPVFRCFTVTVSKEDLFKVKEYLLVAKQSLERALSTGNFRELDLCREFKCGEANCVWFHKCQPEGRYDDPRFRLRQVRPAS